MKLSLSLILAFLATTMNANAQNPLLAAIAKSHECEYELQDLQRENSNLESDYKAIIKELNDGLFCSLCKRSRTQINKTGEEFYTHIKKVAGKVQQAPPEAYQKAKNEFEARKKECTEKVDEKREVCEKMKQDYLQLQVKIQVDEQKKQQSIVQEKYRQLVEEIERKRAEDQQRQAQILGALSNMAQSLKEMSVKAALKLQAKSDRFWDENAEDIKRLARDEVNDFVEDHEVTQEIQGTIDNAKSSVLKMAGITNQRLSNIKTINENGDRLLSMTEKMGNAVESMNTENEAQALQGLESDINKYPTDFANMVLKTPLFLRTPIEAFQSGVNATTEKLQSFKNKVLTIRKIGRSAVKIFFYDE